jgi:putative SOS response-associated peptidase YedK
MCGRFTLTATPEQLVEHFQLDEPLSLSPRYNIAPSQPVATIRIIGQQGRKLQLVRWGLIPSWAKDPKIGYRMINARSETVEEKPAFKKAIKHQRCLVLASGFYEWQHQSKNIKQPFLIQMRDGQPFAFAGLWDQWKSPDGQHIESCTLLTTTANELVAKIHDRMPVILGPEDYVLWLDTDMRDSQRLRSLLKPYPSQEMVAFPVSLRVNNPASDDPQCIEPLHEEKA